MIVYSREAEADVEWFHNWLLAHSVRAAEIFMERLAVAEQRIAARPHAYRQLQDRETRRFSFRLNRTTYLLDYRVEAERVVILRVWLGRQHRPRWLNPETNPSPCAGALLFRREAA